MYFHKKRRLLQHTQKVDVSLLRAVEDIFFRQYDSVNWPYETETDSNNYNFNF